LGDRRYSRELLLLRRQAACNDTSRWAKLRVCSVAIIRALASLIFDSHNNVDITADLSVESSNENNPPPALEWDESLYQWIARLGEGTQGSVDKYLDLVTRRMCAIKRYEFPTEEHTHELHQNITREIAIMSTLSNDPDALLHMVRLLRWYQTREYDQEGSEKHVVRLVMHPVASEGRLLDKLRSQFDAPGADIVRHGFAEATLINLAQGLAMIHRHSVRHKDINTENVLVHEGHAVYTDFGISLYFDPHVSAIGASSTDTATESTLYENTYAAPELLDGHPRSTKSDVFSLGGVIWEVLAARSVAVLGRNDYMDFTFFGDKWLTFEVGEGYAKRLRDGSLLRGFQYIRAEEGMREYMWILDVVERMMRDDPNERLSAEQAYELASSYEGYRNTEHGDWSWKARLARIDDEGKSQVTWRVGTRDVAVDVYHS
jgi:serine/threonine protein kinase